MSQTYKIELREKVAETIRIGKEWRKRVELLNLLPESQMGEMLAKELKLDGWLETEGGKLKQVKDGFELEFDPVSKQLGIRYEEEQEVVVQTEETMDVYDHLDNEQAAQNRAKEILKKRLNEELKDQLIIEETKMREKLDRESKEILNLVDESMSHAIERTHKEALKKKAANLGEIESIDENEAEGEITIRVRL